MTKKLIILFLFACNFVFSQKQIVKVEYDLIYSEDKSFDSGPLKDFYEQAKNNSRYLTFYLISNNFEMNFYSTSSSIEGINTNFSLAFSASNGIRYKRVNENTVYKTFDDYALGKVTLKKDYFYKWNITNETKKISNYTCFKAYTYYEYNNGVGNFKSEITAWFCPDLPYSIGPLGISGLPGLILQLDEKNYVFGAKKIIFSKDQFEFDKNFGSIMTEIEYSSKVTKIMENEKD